MSRRQTLSEKVDSLSKKLDDYIALDTEWKKTAQPTLEIAMQGEGFLKIGKYLIVGLTSIGAFVLTIIKLITYIKR